MAASGASHLKALQKNLELWTITNKELTRAVVRQSNNILQLTHIDERHRWEPHRSLEIEEERERQCDLIVSTHYGELLATFLKLMQVATAIKSSLDAIAAVTFDLIDAEVKRSTSSNIAPAGSPKSLQLLCDASSSLAHQIATISLAYSKELAIKEKAIYYLLPQTCKAAVKRRERALLASSSSEPTIAANDSVSGPFSVILPFTAVFGTGEDDSDASQLPPSRESDRDHLTAIAACLSLQLYVDAKPVLRAVESVEWIVNRGLQVALEG
jgi:hypothetical protein